MSDLSDVESSLDPETPITEPQTPLGYGRKVLQCPYQGCTKSFNRQARLNEHIRSHTNERPFDCPEKACHKAFLRDSHLKHHIKSAHSNERDYFCTWANCEKKFATGTRLRRHESSHQAKEKYTCKGFEGCNESFRKHATLSRHILSVHENKKPFPCTELDAERGEPCKSGFDTAEKLRSHKRAVHDDTRFVCLDCAVFDDELDSQVSFATYALLQDHILEVHPPTCPQCSLLCTSEKDLRRHLELTHGIVDPQAETTSIPTFSCTYPNCTRSFTKRGNLNVHIKTVHEHRKDFVCGQTELKLPHQLPDNQDPEPVETTEITGCGRHFTSKATLEEHVRIVHLGMSSKRQERNQKRRAEQVTDVGDKEPENQSKPKRRKRSQGGKSAIAQLTGSASQAVATGFQETSEIINPFDGAVYPTGYGNDVDHAFDAPRIPSYDYDYDYIPPHNEPAEEEYLAEPNFDAELSSLATSALVDPLLLLG
jgi:general transcription factor IIIA